MGLPSPFAGDPSPPLLSLDPGGVAATEGVEVAADLKAGVNVAVVLPRKATCSNSDRRALCKLSTALSVGFTSTSRVYRAMLTRKRISW